MPSSGRARHALGAATATILVGAPASAAAAATGDTPIRLEYEAGRGCPDRDSFVASLRARTDRFDVVDGDVGAGPRAIEYRVTLVPGDGVTGRVESVSPDGSSSSRELRGSTCAEVADALALVVALDIDAHATAAQDPSPSPEPGVAVVPEPRLSAPAAPAVLPGPHEAPLPRVARSPSRWHFYASAGVSASGGATPGALVGPEALVEARLAPESSHALTLGLDARLGVSVGWSSADGPEGDAARFTRTAVLLDVCPLRVAAGPFEASACARVEGGSLEADGAGMAVSLRTTRPWLAGGGLALVRWTPVEPLFVQLEGGATVAFVRDRFSFDDPPALLYAVPAIGPLASAAVGARFW